jgi:hypothetical protein
MAQLGVIIDVHYFSATAVDLCITAIISYQVRAGSPLSPIVRHIEPRTAL